jgi:hypothetical protein
LRPDSDRLMQREKQGRQRPAPLELSQAMPLVERALQVLERRGVQAQLGLLKSTMLQLDSSFSEKAYGVNSFSDFVDKIKKSDFVDVNGSEGRYVISRKSSSQQPERSAPKPDEALPMLRDVLETHRLEIEDGCLAEELSVWVQDEVPHFDSKRYGFQEFAEFLNYAQDKLLVRVEPDKEKGLLVYLGAEFYPPAEPEPDPPTAIEEEIEEPQPIVKGQPTAMGLPVPEEDPEPPKARKRVRKAPVKKASSSDGNRAPRTTRPRTRKPKS